MRQVPVPALVERHLQPGAQNPSHTDQPPAHLRHLLQYAARQQADNAMWWEAHLSWCSKLVIRCCTDAYTGATLMQCKSRTESLLTSKHSKPRSAISKALFFFSSRSIARYWLLVTALALPWMHEGNVNVNTSQTTTPKKPTPSQRPAETSPACIAKHMPPRQGGLATPDLTRCSTPQLSYMRRPHLRFVPASSSRAVPWDGSSMKFCKPLTSCAI